MLENALRQFIHNLRTHHLEDPDNPETWVQQEIAAELEDVLEDKEIQKELELTYLLR